MKNAIIAAFLAFAGLAGAQTNLTVSPNVHSILQAANYAAIRGLLDVEPGTDYLTPSAIAAAYQPLNAKLTNIGGLTDPNADRILFWNDSAGAYAHMTIGSGLTVSGGTTLTATGGSFDSAADYTLTGTWDFTSATLTMGDLGVGTLDAASLEIGGVAVTSTAAELNVLDGVAAGLTATELSVLDGIPGTLTATELGYVDGVTSAIQTQINTKAPNAGTQTGVHATPSTTNPLSPTWTGPMHTVWYGAAGTINLPAASGYTGRGLLVYNTGAFTVTIDPNASEVVVRDGTVQTGGVSFTLSSGAGNFVAILSDGARWVTLGFKGTLSVGS